MLETMRALVAIGLVGLVAGFGCKKDEEAAEPEEGADESKAAEAAPERSEEAADLWALAPPEAQGGIVARAGAIERLAGGIQALRAGYARLPGAEQRLAAIDSAVGNPAGFPMLRPDEWEGFGLDTSKPGALFLVDGGAAVVLPVGDREVFLREVDGTAGDDGEPDRIADASCDAIDGRYVCAMPGDLLAGIGEGGDVARAGADRPAELLGDIEGYVSPELMDKPLDAFRFAASLDRGAITLRASLGVDTSRIPPIFSTKPRTLTDEMAEVSPAGFFHAHAPLAMAAMAAPAEPTPLGVSAQEIVTALTGELVGYSLSGDTPSGYVKLGVSDAEVFRRILSALCPIAAQNPGIEAKLEEGRCRGSASPDRIAAAAGAQGSATPIGEFAFDVSVVDEALVAAIGKPGKRPAPVEISPAGKELLEGSWNLALWGSGDIPPGSLAAATETVEEPARGSHAMQTITWAARHLTELGVGVRVDGDKLDALVRVGTQWANPPEVVASLEPLLARAAIGEDVGADIEALAEEHPDSTLARSRGRAAGLLPVAGALGITAAIAVPAFTRYVARSKTTEARAMLQRMAAGAQAHYAENGSYPRSGAGPTPAKGACCEGGANRCTPAPEPWKGPTWEALGFSILDPHYYSYEYEVARGGQAFTVRAHGDLDCDGTYSTFELSGEGGGAGEIVTRNELE